MKIGKVIAEPETFCFKLKLVNFVAATAEYSSLICTRCTQLQQNKEKSY